MQVCYTIFLGQIIPCRLISSGSAGLGTVSYLSSGSAGCWQRDLILPGACGGPDLSLNHSNTRDRTIGTIIFVVQTYILVSNAWGHTTSLIQKHARSPLLQRKMMYHDIFIIFCSRDVTATSAEFQPRTLMVSIRRGQMTHKPCSYCGLQIDRWRAPQNVSDWLQHEFSVGPTTTLK